MGSERDPPGTSVFFYIFYVRFLQKGAPDGLLYVRFLEYVRFFTVCQISYVRFSGFEAKFEGFFNKRGVGM